MADEVVGVVRVDVHGNTQPLKQDIRRAAKDVGDEVNAAAAAGVNNNVVTETIVDHIDAAEKPAAESGERVGKTVGKSMAKGVKDDKFLDAEMQRMFSSLDRRVGEMAREMAQNLSEGLGQPVENIQAEIEKQFRAKLDNTRTTEIGRAAGRQIRESIEAEFRDTDIDTSQMKRALDSVFGPSDAARMRSRAQRAGEDSGNAFSNGMRQMIGSNLISSAIKMFGGLAAKAGLIVTAVKPAISVVAGLTAQIASLSASLGAVGVVGAGSLFTMLPALAAIKIGFSGMDKEAKKAFSDNLKNAAGDLKKFKDGVQKELTPALVESVKTVSQLAPELNKFGKEAAAAAGVVAKEFSRVLVGRRAEIREITSNSADMLQRLGLAVTKLLGPALGALAAMQPLISRFMDSITTGLERFARSLDLAVNTGQFEQTLERWYDRGVSLITGFKNLGTVIVNVFRIAANSAGDFSKSFEEVTQGWADWSNSVKGQNQIKKVFDQAKPVIHEVWGLLGDIAGLFRESFTGDTENLTAFIHSIRQNVIPTLEALQEIVRESGIQDALYDFADALIEMLKAGGGSAMRAFIALLTDFVKIAAQLLDWLGPLTGPLLTFVGAMKAMSLVQKFPGISLLPTLFTKIVGPANNATKAVEGVTGALNEEGNGATERRIGRADKAMRGLKTAGNIAAGAFTLLVTLQETLGHTMEDAGITVDGLTRSLEHGATAMETLSNLRLPAGWIPQRTHDDFTALDEIIKDLGTDWSATVNRWGAEHLGIDPADTKASVDVINAMITAFAQAAATSGDVVGAKNKMDAFIKDLKDRGVDVSLFADAINDTNLALNDLANTTATSGFFGDFSSLKKSADTFGFAWDSATQKALDGLYQIDQYVDPTTGRLNKKGMEVRAKIIAEADLDSINGVDNLITENTEKKIRKILLDPQYLDENGQPTEKGVIEIRKAIIKDLETTKDARDEATKEINDFMAQTAITFQPDFDWSKVKENAKTLPALMAKQGFGDLKTMLGLSPEDLGGSKAKAREIAARFSDALNQEKLKLEVDPAFKGHPELIFQALKDRANEILHDVRVDVATEDALDNLTKLKGILPEDLAMGVEMNNVKYAQVGNKLLELTRGPDGTSVWTAVIDSEANTVKAKNDFATLVKGPDGEWKIKIVAHADTTEAEQTLTDMAKKTYNTTVFADVVINKKFLYFDPRTGTYSAGGSLSGLKGEVTGSALIPGGGIPVTPAAPAASMFSMGAPTMGGPELAAGGLQASLRGDSGGPTAGGYTSSGGKMTNDPFAWQNQDESKSVVTINNYYPEPERVSDSIAMSLRIARLETAGA